MTFTIFTGTYNASKFIDRVFQSLLSQTYKNYEWIVIDDASSDNTVELLHQFKKTNSDLEITIISNPCNLGIAENRRHAISLSKGSYFVTWDHDDEHVPDQLNLFKKYWEEFGSEKVANLFAFCKDQHGNVLGKQFSKGNHVANYFTYYKSHIMSHQGVTEKHVCVKTEILRKYFDFEFEEGPITDGSMLWAKMALHYDCIFINEALRIYYIENENLQSMSKRSRLQMSNHHYFEKKIWVNHYLHRIKKDKLLCLRIIFAMVFYGQLSGHSLNNILSEINRWDNRMIASLMIAPSRLMLMKMKIKYNQ